MLELPNQLKLGVRLAKWYFQEAVEGSLEVRLELYFKG